MKKYFLYFVGNALQIFLRIAEKARLEKTKRQLCYCGEDVVLYKGVSIVYPRNVSIGSHSHVGESAHLRASENSRIIIGDWCQIANNVIIATGDHNIDGHLYYENVLLADVVIGNNVWIASNAIIVPGTRIGNNSVVAAGSVVTKDVPDNVVVGGVPAKFIKKVPSI